ncbi:MAG: BlaI/MecI/CopY family transcriptional regulator [Acutalibacteraceae bacterium]
MIRKRLPEAEFGIMKTLWSLPAPVTSCDVQSAIKDKPIKNQTVTTVLTRLEKKGFLRSEKHGKERQYFVVVTEKEYMNFEAASFFSKFKKNDVSDFVSSLYDGGVLDEKDIDELTDWLNERKKNL